MKYKKAAQQLVEFAKAGNVEEMDKLIQSVLKKEASLGQMTLKRLGLRSSVAFTEFITYDDCGALSAAAENGDLSVLNKLLEYPDVTKHLADIRLNPILYTVMKFKKMEVFNKLLEQPSVVQNLNAYILSFAISVEMPEMVAKLLEYPTMINNIVYNVNEVFRVAIENKNFVTIEKLLRYPAVRSAVMQHGSYILNLAGAYGYMDFVDNLLEYPDVVLNIAFDRNAALLVAVKSGWLVTAEKLLKYDAVVQNIAVANNLILFSAVKLGNINFINKLLGYDAVVQNIAAQDNAVFRAAVKIGDIDIINELLKYDAVVQYIDACGNEAIINAVSKGNEEVVLRLLEYPKVFAYSEMHVHEHGSYVNTFVTKYMQNLNEKINDFSIHSPGAAFDLTVENEIQMAYFVLRNLIRAHSPANNNLVEINQLLSIPAISARASDRDNELLVLTMRGNMNDITRRLIQIPAVRVLAEQNNFYVNQIQGQINLRDLADNPESSMTALSQHERDILQNVKDKYAELSQSLGGHKGVLSKFKEYLESEYNKNPAKIITRGKEIKLPFSWAELQKMQTSLGHDYNDALAAYYAHDIHTAHRYFLKPNPWMAPDSKYTSTLSGNAGQYSAFEGYIPMIADLWLAVSDVNEGKRDDIDVDGRIKEFIRSIAHINRGHNWDKTRKNATTRKREEYDDLRGDDPSCYSGVFRRLFQAVLAHSLFKVGATKDVLEHELRSFVFDYYKTLLNDQAPSMLKGIHDDIEKSSIELVLTPENKIPNIPVKNQQDFLTAIERKYKITEADLYYHEKFKKVFEIDPALKLTDLEQNHFIRFSTRFGLMELLRTTMEDKQKPSGDNKMRPISG